MMRESLREKSGKTAVCKAEVNDNSWICICGKENALAQPNCTRCGRKMESPNEEDRDLPKDPIKRSLREHLEYALSFKTYYGLVRYLQNQKQFCSEKEASIIDHLISFSEDQIRQEIEDYLAKN